MFTRAMWSDPLFLLAIAMILFLSALIGRVTHPLAGIVAGAFLIFMWTFFIAPLAR